MSQLECAGVAHESELIEKAQRELGETGSEPKHELMCFNRATTTCEEGEVGASRHLRLSDAATGQGIGLTGSTGFLSSYAEGDKAVLAALRP